MHSVGILNDFGIAEKMKTGIVKGAFWRYLDFLCQYLWVLNPHTHWPSFLLNFWVFYLYDVVEKVACPSLQDLHVATHRGGSRILCWGRGAWGSGSAPPDNFENIDGKMEHSNAIWNVNLELQRQVKNKIERIFLHYLKPFGITENILKTKDAKWYILTLFGTAENFLKTRTVKGEFWRYLKELGTAEKNLKTGTLNGAFWLYLILYFLLICSMDTSCLLYDLHDIDVLVSVYYSFLWHATTLVSTHDVYYILNFISYYTLTGSPHI